MSTTDATPAEMRSNEEIIGRADVNDLAEILSITNSDVHETIRSVADNADAIFTWDYEKGARKPLDKLYEKAKTSQWNGETDLPWETDVDQEQVVMANQAAGLALDADIDITGTPFEKWGDKEWLQLGVEIQNWTPQPVHARRAGRPDLHGQDRRDGAVDRRQVLRRHPGDGRGPPRRGVRQVPRHQARRATTRSTPTSACSSTTSSRTPAGT